MIKPGGNAVSGVASNHDESRHTVDLKDVIPRHWVWFYYHKFKGRNVLRSKDASN